MKSQVETKKYGFQRERGFAFFLPETPKKKKSRRREERFPFLGSSAQCFLCELLSFLFLVNLL
jgi:hypothetical protein